MAIDKAVTINAVRTSYFLVLLQFMRLMTTPEMNVDIPEAPSNSTPITVVRIKCNSGKHEIFSKSKFLVHSWI